MSPHSSDIDGPSEPSTVQRNEQLVREYFDAVWNEGDLSVFDTDLVSDDYVMHHQSDAEYLLADLRTAWADWYQGFSGLSNEVEDLIATEDRVVVRYRFSGTHDGPVMDVPATGKHVETVGIVVFRIEDGRLAEEWAMDDVFGLLQQLGGIGETTASVR